MSEKINPVNVAATALEHPFGHEIVGMVYEMFKAAQVKVEPDARLVAIAVQMSKSLEPYQVPYFKGMTDDEIRQWINQHS